MTIRQPYKVAVGEQKEKKKKKKHNEFMDTTDEERTE